MSDAPFLIEDMNVWETRMFSVNYPEHSKNRQALLEAIESIRQQQEEAIASYVAPTAKHQLYESSLDLLEQPVPALSDLKIFLEDMLTTVAYAVNEEFWPEDAQAHASIIESWFHVTENGGYHDTHSHPNCSWCGIYYLQAGESGIEQRNGVNRFYDPRHGADQYLDAGTAYLNAAGTWDFAPQEGQIVIFPSYLKHAAMPYFGSQARIVLAFNSQVNFQED